MLSLQKVGQQVTESDQGYDVCFQGGMDPAEYHMRECVPGTAVVAAELITPKDQEATSLILAASVLGLGDEMDGSPEPHEHRNPDGHAGRVMNVLVEIENMLAESLPAVYFAVRNMPLNRSGKTGRRQLQAIGSRFSAKQLAEMRMDSGLARRQLTTTIERALRDIWARVLKI